VLECIDLLGTPRYTTLCLTHSHHTQYHRLPCPTNSGAFLLHLNHSGTLYKDILSHLIDHFLAIIPTMPEAKYISQLNPPSSESESESEWHSIDTALNMCDRLEALLRETFPYVLFEELQALPFAIMQHCQDIPRPFLRRLAGSAQLYKVCCTDRTAALLHQLVDCIASLACVGSVGMSIVCQAQDLADR
jgi:hypothetical protein